jgi:hypothetical protein
MKPKKTPRIEKFASRSHKGRYGWELGDIAFGKIRRIGGKEQRDQDGKIIEE